MLNFDEVSMILLFMIIVKACNLYLSVKLVTSCLILAIVNI
ncbi:hypothetical protein RO3G_04263 [Rhizopus delemar RA 99-880]|uniref:Uncharacterized protein n=1 Tax=Rhizopus delemar (strain RA 99-880 / ATCC MYA-4621 / FGSC 9543 / NRRL 43880) TaxID=246409 RepID=I1BTM8_RHIO9|nr:hypothetical protein RO3G_04263 [Rhizopus delemar RA 99-880]|eukprot:EIE79558.1 hypothetical protein RO3G_04263 [Rhizopus delemar RA 99-880]